MIAMIMTMIAITVAESAPSKGSSGARVPKIGSPGKFTKQVHLFFAIYKVISLCLGPNTSRKRFKLHYQINGSYSE